MAREWFGRRRRAADADDGMAEDHDPETGPVDLSPDDPVAAELESVHVDADLRESGLELHEESDEEDSDHPPLPDTTPLAERLEALGRHAMAVGAARLPGIRAALVPRSPRLAVTIVAGLLLCASFPATNWWWAAVVAFALLAWVLTRPATTPAGGFGYGFLFGLAFYLPLLPWISLLVGDVPWVALSIAASLFPGLFGLCAVVVRRLPGWPLCFAAVWAAQEWLKALIPFGGFPWGSVAFGQAEGPLLPLVQLGGTALLSASVALVGCCVTAIALEIVKWWQAGGQARRSGRGEVEKAELPPPAVLLPGICICVVLFAAVIVWPQVRHAGTGSGGEPTVTVAAVQGNVPRLGFDFNAQRRAVLDNHVQETLRLAEDVRSGAAPQPQFVIWPEDSSDIDPLINLDAGQEISRAAKAIGAPILVGTILAVPGHMQEPAEYTNTVIVWDPGTGPADRHDKEIVQPFGEYLPMPWLFKHLSGYANRAGHIVPGQSNGVVHIAGVPVGVATCWEVTYDRASRKAVRNGAQLLAIPSNNATFNKTMSEQQLAFAKVRAVEHDRYVVVAGTTGISAVIAPDGRELVRTDFFEPAYLDMQVRLKTGLTPGTQWGPIVQWILVAAAGAVILAGIRHNGWFSRPIRLRSRPRSKSEDDANPDEGQAVGDAAPDDEVEAETAEQTPPEDGGRHSYGFGRHRGAK